MAKRRFYRGSPTARRGHYQGAWTFIGRFGGERGRRYRSISHERHAARRLAQRGDLFGWKLRGRKRFDFVISGTRPRRQMGNCAKTSDQRLQPREDRQIRRGTEGREIYGGRVARRWIKQNAVIPNGVRDLSHEVYVTLPHQGD